MTNLLRFTTVTTRDYFCVGWGNLFRSGRSAADVDQGEALEEMTIVERLGRAIWGFDRHKTFQATDMPQE